MNNNSKILIGNIGSSADEEKIRELFAGTKGVVISVTIPKDQKGNNRGYAFVEMGTELEAAQAVSDLHGTGVDGRSMSITLVEKLKSKRKWFQFGAK